MAKQPISIKCLASSHDASQVGVIIRGSQAQGSRRDGRNDNRNCPGCDLPQGNGALFLELRMRRQVLKGKNVACGKRDNARWINGPSQFAESLQQGDELVSGTIIRNHQDQRPINVSLQQNQQQSLSCGRQSSNTNPPRALFQMEGCTRKSG